MSSSAFDGTPARREDVSMRLRVQRMKNVSEQTKLLEEESRKMEERLQELKLAMGREKEEREKQGGGFWKTGQLGALANHAQVVLNSSADLAKNKEGKPRKIKVIKDEPSPASTSSAGGKGSNRPAVPGTMAFLLQKENAKASPGGQHRGTAGGSRSAAASGSSKSGGPLCGQCEQLAAVVSCFECSEQYCAHCFASFHLRGALKKHRSAPLIASGAAPPVPPSENVRRGQSAAPAAEQPPPSGRLPAGAGESRGGGAGAEDSGRGSAKRWAVPAQHRPVHGDKSGAAAAKTGATLLASHANWRSESSLEVIRNERDTSISVSSAARAQGADASASLLNGAFNEEDSALSFQEALKQWRSAGTTNSDSSTATKLSLKPAASKPMPEKSHGNTASVGVDEGTSTASLKRVPYEPEFQSSSGLTYADRLLLKTHRRTELGPMTERSDSARDVSSPSTRLTSVTNGFHDSGDETGTVEVGAEADELPAVDFTQLRDLMTPRDQYTSSESVNQRTVEEMVDIVEADSLSDDGPVEEVRYTVIEDGEVLEDRVQSAAPVPKKALGKNDSKIKRAAAPLRTSSDGLGKRSTLPNARHVSKTQVAPPGPTTLEPPANTSRRKTASPDAFAGTAAAVGKAPSGGLLGTAEQSVAGKASSTTDVGAKLAEQMLSSRTERRPQSRPSSRARPPTRARSRAEKAAELRKGGLSLEASHGLKEVSRRLSDNTAGANTVDALHVDALGDFFRLWLPAEQVERTLTPTFHKKSKNADSDGNAAGLQKHHVSNKIYLTSPQVWRPHSSTAGAVPEEEALRHMNSLPNDDLMLAVGDGAQMVDLIDSGLHLDASVKNSPGSNLLNATSQPVTHVELKQTSDGPSQLPVSNEPLSAPPEAARSRVVHPGPRQSITPRRFAERHNAPQTADSQQSAASLRRSGKGGTSSYDYTGSAHEERVTAVAAAGNVANCDLALDLTQSSEGSDELRALDELERELASATGRLTAEGIKSCLPDSLDAEDLSPAQQYGDESIGGGGSNDDRDGRRGAAQTSGNEAQRSWDLRESMMHDFEDMEQAFADEIDG